MTAPKPLSPLTRIETGLCVMAISKRAESKQKRPEQSVDPGHIRFSFRGGEFAVRTALATVLRGLRHLDLSVEEAGSVELVLAEILNNVVEHAYGAEPPGRIEISCNHGKNGLSFRVIDDGRAMPDGQAPLGVCSDVNVPHDAMPEGGFGWFLIRNLTKDLKYNRVGHRNILSFRLQIRQAD